MSKFSSVIVFIIFTLAIIPLLIDHREVSDPGSGNKSIQIIFAILYAVIFIICSIRAKKFGMVVSKDLILVLLLLFAFASLFWSDFQAIGLRRIIGLFGATMIGFYWAFKYKINDMIRIGFHAYSIIVSLSFIFIYLYPQLGVHQGLLHYGLPRGVFTHKNMLGENMMYAALFSIYFFAVAKKKLAKLWASILLCSSIFLLIGSQSSTALVVVLASLSVIFAIRLSLRMKPNLLISLIFTSVGAAGLLGFYLYNNFDNVLSLLGKDPSLTGRTNLWSETWQAIGQNPIMGYGYQSFWDLHPLAISIGDNINWDAHHAHNGLLDILIQVGFLGLILFLFSFLKSYWSAFVLTLRGKTFIGSLPLIIFTLAVLYNITESNILNPNSTFWALFVYASIRSRMGITEEETEISPLLSESPLPWNRSRTVAGIAIRSHWRHQKRDGT